MNDFSNFSCLITEPEKNFDSQWALQKNGIAKKKLGHPNLAKWCGVSRKICEANVKNWWNLSK